MSILIKGGTTIEELQSAMLMFKGHEIVELPDHGDLIDRDALKNELFTDTTDCDLEMIEFEYVSAAPVVIPGERSEDATD